MFVCSNEPCVNTRFVRIDFGRRLRYAHSPEIIEVFYYNVCKITTKMRVYTQTIIIFKNSVAAIISHLNALL